MRTVLNLVPVFLIVSFAVFLSFLMAVIANGAILTGSIFVSIPALLCAGGFAGIAALVLIQND
jgi:hypothetical protein